jgi:hypothetical protein
MESYPQIEPAEGWLLVDVLGRCVPISSAPLCGTGLSARHPLYEFESQQAFL